MKLMSAMVVVGVFGAAAAGCGSSEKTPVEKCEELMSTVCDRLVHCIAGASGMQAQCVAATQQVTSCKATKSVGASYDRCIDQLHDLSCSALFPLDPITRQPTATLPIECRGVLLMGAPGADRPELATARTDEPSLVDEVAASVRDAVTEE